MLIRSITAAAALLASPWASAQEVPEVPWESGQSAPRAMACADAGITLEQTPEGIQISELCDADQCLEEGLAIRRERDGVAITKVCASDLPPEDSQPAIPYYSLPSQVSGIVDGAVQQQTDGLFTTRVSFEVNDIAWSCISINGALCPPSLHEV